MFDNYFFWPFTALFVGVLGIIKLLFLIFWIWMIVDVAKRTFRSDIEKIVWLLIVVLANFVGAFVYFIVIRMYNTKGLSK